MRPVKYLAKTIEMRALLIRSINLPPQIKDAIESKLKTEQEALAYEFRLRRKNRKPNAGGLKPKERQPTTR